MRILVLGGRGFIGRHVVSSLRARGDEVVVGSRRSGGGAVAARLDRLLDAADWTPLVEGVDAVVNCVGILRERIGESYDAIHHRAPGALAVACASAGIRLVHVSALGLDGARHPFMTSKRRGEEAILSALDDVAIVRPSLLDGDGGFGARWIRAMARLPVHGVPAQATGRIAPLAVDELGEAIAAVCHAPRGALARVLELGGPRALPFAAYLRSLRSSIRAPRTVRVPHAAARAVAWCCDRLHFSPYSAGHLELLTRDNVPGRNDLPALIGRAPRPIGPALNPSRCRRKAPSPSSLPSSLRG